MRRAAHSGFLLAGREVENDILIPRYYDPRIRAAAKLLEPRFRLVPLSALVEQGAVSHDHGKYVPKIHYGSGPYPYLRTSDIANWEVMASPKHGVSEDVFEAYKAFSDCRPGDILFVHEGTYLIGSVAMVTAYDGPMLYQHHLARFRVKESAEFRDYFLLAALGSPFVQWQIRSKQFSADIIDSVVGRLEEVLIPIPREARELRAVEKEVETCVMSRGRDRAKLSAFFSELDGWLLRGSPRLDDLLEWEPSPDQAARTPAFLGERLGSRSFLVPAEKAVNDILVPKYYDPFVQELGRDYSRRCDLRTIEELMSLQAITLDTGDEIGRLNYGSGTIPFVRTSDLGSFELRRDPKHGVSLGVWEAWSADQCVAPGDILLIRDGTYLVGSTTLVFEADLPMLYCGGIIKLRALDSALLPSGLLYALLNTPFVKRQMRSKQFTRDVIDTLGRRLREVVLPIPRDAGMRGLISNHVMRLCEDRVGKRARLNSLVRGLFGVGAD